MPLGDRRIDQRFIGFDGALKAEFAPEAEWLDLLLSTSAAGKIPARNRWSEFLQLAGN
jgi:hypothetical protein